MNPALIVHIGAGGIGLATGAVTMSVRKGATLHRAFGDAFTVAMLTMAVAAFGMAVTIPERGNALGGLFTFYLVASGWLTMHRAPGHIGWAEIVGLCVAVATVATGVMFGLQAGWSATGELDGVPPPNFYVTSAVALLAASLDFKVILRGGSIGVPRQARHLWRMSVGFFIATGSFFLGQQKVMPVWIQGSPVLFVLALAPLVLMVFWLIRVRVGKGVGVARIVVPPAA